MISSDFMKLQMNSMRQRPNNLPRSQVVLELENPLDISEDNNLDLNNLPIAKNFLPG